MKDLRVNSLFLFSFKQIKALLKDDESPLFVSSGRREAKVSISRAIYDLIHHGIKQHIKKDSLLGALSDLCVSIS